MVVVVVSVAVAWHMGEYVATSSSAIVVVVKRGTMALVLLMGSVKEIIVGYSWCQASSDASSMAIGFAGLQVYG